MRKRTVSVAVVSMLAASMLFAGTAFAASPNHAAPGTPGTPGCVGQTTAYLAQAASTVDLGINPGIGNLADAAGLTVAEVHQVVIDYCGS